MAILGMDSSQSWLVEFKRKLDEFDARMDLRWGALEQRVAAVKPCIGGLEQTSATHLVKVDNWGGLFDQIRTPDTTFSDSSSPPPVTQQHALDAVATEEIEPEANPHQKREGLQDTNIEMAISQCAPRPGGVFDPGLCVFEPPALLAYADATRADADDPVDLGSKSELHGATHRGGGRAIRLRMRARRTKTVRRRRHPLRSRLWRPPWRFTSCRRCPRRHGHRIRSCALHRDTEAGDALLPRRLTERFDRNSFLRGGTLQLVEISIFNHAVVRRALRVRDDVLLIASVALAEQATKDYLAKAFELIHASRLPLPDDFVKDAESCMYTPTACSTQALKGNERGKTFCIERVIFGCGNSGAGICLAFCNHSALPSMVVRKAVHILKLWVFDEMWSYHLVQECWHERFLEEAKSIKAISNDFRLLDIRMLFSSLVARGGTKIVHGFKMGAGIVLLSDGHHVQIHTFGFSSYNDYASIHAISYISSSTFLFIDAEGSMQEGFAHGLLGVVVKEMRLGIQCHGMLLNSIKSVGYTSQVPENGHGGSVNVGDLSADEEKGILVTLCYGLLAVQYKPPLPTPNQFAILSYGVQYEFNLQCWKNCIELPPWPPPSHQYFRIVQAGNVGSWKHLTVITEWSLHVHVQEFQSSQGTNLFLSEALKLKWMRPMLQFPWSPSLFFEINGGEAQLKPFCISYTTPAFWTTSRSLSMMVSGSMASQLDVQWLVADPDQLSFCNSRCTAAGLFWFQVIWVLTAFVLPTCSVQLKRGGLTQFDSLLWSSIWPEKEHQLLRSSDERPSSSCEADLLFRVLNHGLKFTSIQELVEPAWGQAAFQGKGNVRYLHQMGCLSYGPRPNWPRNKPKQKLQEHGRKVAFGINQIIQSIVFVCVERERGDLAAGGS